MELEYLAIVWGIRRIRDYLERYPFTVITDHQSLRWLQKLETLLGQLGLRAIWPWDPVPEGDVKPGRRCVIATINNRDRRHYTEYRRTSQYATASTDTPIIKCATGNYIAIYFRISISRRSPRSHSRKSTFRRKAGKILYNNHHDATAWVSQKHGFTIGREWWGRPRDTCGAARIAWRIRWHRRNWRCMPWQ